jgi:hypothetical protein
MAYAKWRSKCPVFRSSLYWTIWLPEQKKYRFCMVWILDIQYLNPHCIGMFVHFSFTTSLVNTHHFFKCLKLNLCRKTCKNIFVPVVAVAVFMNAPLIFCYKWREEKKAIRSSSELNFSSINGHRRLGTWEYKDGSEIWIQLKKNGRPSFFRPLENWTNLFGFWMVR